jgi:hypothetical protein
MLKSEPSRVFAAANYAVYGVTVYQITLPAN